MRALIQRVHKASVTVEEKVIANIGKGLLIFLGVGKDDRKIEAEALANKILQLRIFSNNEGKFDLSIQEIQGDILVVSQFTLYGNAWKGCRPDFTAAAPPEKAAYLYEWFVYDISKKLGKETLTGSFGSHMDVSLINDGPVSLWLEKTPS